MRFENIRNIDLSNKKSWKNKIFLTFDIDWCSDEILAYTLNIVEKYNLKVTFFITHETKLLKRMKENPNIELGIHPNFNFLLNGDFRYGKNIEEVINHYMKIVPEAISVRSHSMTQSSQILSYFSQCNLKYDCNHYIPQNAGIRLKPWQYLNSSLVKIPYFWEDDLHCIHQDNWNINDYINFEGLKVFNFHPIHIYLNTEHLDRYNNTRKKHYNHEELSFHVNNTSRGTCNFLIDLIERIK